MDGTMMMMICWICEAFAVQRTKRKHTDEKYNGIDELTILTTLFDCRLERRWLGFLLRGHILYVISPLFMI